MTEWRRDEHTEELSSASTAADGIYDKFTQVIWQRCNCSIIMQATARLKYAQICKAATDYCRKLLAEEQKQQ